MIIAIQRFRGGDTLADVIGAHLAPAACPGLLGVHCVTDARDPERLTVVSRWTGAESLRAWRDGEGAGAAGAAATLADLLARAGAVPVEEAVLDLGAPMARFLADSRALHLIVCGADGRILLVNPAMTEALRAPAPALVGTPLTRHLTAGDAARVASHLSGGEAAADERRLMTFVDAAELPFSLSCRLDMDAGCLVILGEPTEVPDRRLHEELMRVTNELAVVARERERARREHAEALRKLQESYWHLRKLQEVLPICMQCNRVKSDVGRWETVVDYLRNNDLLLSHGLCPSCFAAMELDE